MSVSRSIRFFSPIALLLASCHPSAEPTSPSGAAATAAGSTANPATAAPAASSYPMCAGQHLAKAPEAAHSGAVDAQLAPAFLDEMAVCRADDRPPHDLIASAPEGRVNAKGDCEFPGISVSCHYHSGEEFVSSATHQQTQGEGELHCIFPSSDPKAPRVFGTHVMCRNHAQGEPHGAASHDVHAGAVCSAELLRQLEPCNERRCCDAGTLTNPIGELKESHRNDVRPDFRICQDTLTLDCDLLAALTVHAANCPALGGVGDPAFVANAAQH